MGLILQSLGLRVQPWDALPLMHLSTTGLCPVMLYAITCLLCALQDHRTACSYWSIHSSTDLCTSGCMTLDPWIRGSGPIDGLTVSETLDTSSIYIRRMYL